MKPYMSPIPCLRQRRYSPARQWSHDRQDWNTSTATRSPAATPHRSDADAPIASMRPTVSWPGTNANPPWSSPVYCS